MIGKFSERNRRADRLRDRRPVSTCLGGRAIKLARTKAGPTPLDEIDRDPMRR